MQQDRGRVRERNRRESLAAGFTHPKAPFRPTLQVIHALRRSNHLRRLGSSLSNAIRLQPGASQDARRPEDLAARCPDDLNGALRVRTLSELLDFEAEVRFAAPRLKLFTVFLCNLTSKYNEI